MPQYNVGLIIYCIRSNNNNNNNNNNHLNAVCPGHPGRPVPEETFTRSHPSWSTYSILYTASANDAKINETAKYIVLSNEN